MSTVRRTVSILLITAGLGCVAWPAVMKEMGSYYQQQLDADFPQDVAEPVLVSVAPIATHTVKPSPDTRKAKVKAKPTASITEKRINPRWKPIGKQAKPSKEPSRLWMPKEQAPIAGKAFARLWINRLNLKVVVVEGANSSALRRGPGHVSASGLPGQNRNCVIAAHRDSWFEQLSHLKIGDPILLESRTGLYNCTVTERKVVTPNRTDLLNRGHRPELTLVTCTGPGYPHSRYRLLVFCRLTALGTRRLAMHPVQQPLEEIF